MDEARRFLRYVMPGFVYGIETPLWLLIIFPTWTQSIMANLMMKDGLGVTLGRVLTAGALGYIFAAIHHVCHWLPLCFEKGIFDHSSIVRKILNKPDDEKIERPEALKVSLAYWCQQVDGGAIKDTAEKKVNSLGDQAHALGAARVASVSPSSQL